MIDFLNHRRWLTPDLLCGRVIPGHALWKFLLKCGIKESELDEFAEHPCPPSVLGLNHYLTSDRFLDDQVERYPPNQRASADGRHFVDLDAVRACAECQVGSADILREMWKRYSIPVGITEIHLGCTREEQMRWFAEALDAAHKIRREGVNLLAVTAWSLLGSFNWNVLVRKDSGFYEPGVFDIRSSSPRPTALANLVRTAAAGKELQHPLLESRGWWQRPERLLHQNQRAFVQSVRCRVLSKVDGCYRQQPLLILGATGTLGKTFAKLCDIRGIKHQPVGREHVDLHNLNSIVDALEEIQPWAVVNAAGYVRVDEAEQDKGDCLRTNTHGSTALAQICERRKVKLLAFSSDLVFDGKAGRPYVESDLPNPLNWYGKSKALMESKVLDICSSALVIRTSAFFGPSDRSNFVVRVLETLNKGRTFPAADNVIVSPTFTIDLVNAALDLLADDEAGIWHLSNAGAISWAELGRKTAHIAGLRDDLIDCRPIDSFGLAARRPRFSALTSERGSLMAPLENALQRCIEQWHRLHHEIDRSSLAVA